MKGYLLLLPLLTFMGAVASLFFKKASGSDGIIKLLLNINLYIGGLLYLLSAVLNIIVLRYLDYSIVLPLTSMTYIWTMVISYLVLREKITFKKMAGVALILVGAVILAL